MAFKDLSRRTASDKVLLEKAFNIAKNSKYDSYQKGIFFYNFLIKSHLLVLLKVKICQTNI